MDSKRRWNCLICLDSGTQPVWKPTANGAALMVDYMKPCEHCRQGQHKYSKGVCLCGAKKEKR